MKYSFFACLFFAAFLCAAMLKAQTDASSSAFDIDAFLKTFPSKLATYDGTKSVDSTDFKSLVKNRLALMSQNGQVVERKLLEQIIYQQAEGYVMQEVTIAEAEKRGLKPDLEATKKQIEELKKQSNGKEQIKHYMQIFNCKDYDEFIAKQARMRMAQQVVVQELDKTTVTEEDAKKFYDDNPQFFTKLSASHILVHFSDNSKIPPTAKQEAAALKKIQEIEKELKNGGDFAKLAKKYSDCPSKDKGGDLGQFTMGQMVPEFEEALLNMQPNEISGPVKTRFGYHLIKAGEKDFMAFIDIKDKLMQTLKAEKSQKTAEQFMEKLKKDHQVKMLLMKPEISK